MVKHQSKCLLEVTKSSSHNPSDRMIESFTNQTHHNQPPLYQKHMGTYCFNTHLDVFIPVNCSLVKSSLVAMTTNGVNTLTETKDGREFFNSDGTDVKPEVISMLGPFARVWKTASQRAKEMSHTLTTFSPEKVITAGGAKHVRIPPGIEKCDQNRGAYSDRMGAIKMEWPVFANTVDNVQKDAGIQLKI